MKVRKRTIKKPKIILSYLGSLIVVSAFMACIGLLLYNNAAWEYYNAASKEITYYEQSVSNTVLAALDKENVTPQDIAKLKARLVFVYTATGMRSKVYYNQKQVADSSWNIIMHYAPDGDSDSDSDTVPDSRRLYYFELADEKYMKYFETPEVLQYKAVVPVITNMTGSIYEAKFNENPVIELAVTEAYIDIENAKFIPVTCHICDTKAVGRDGISDVVVKIPVDKDSPELKGYKHIVSNGVDFFSATIEGYQGEDNEADYTGASFALNDYNVYFGDKSTELVYKSFSEAYKSQITTGLCILAGAAVALSFIPAAFVYSRQKKNYEIYEYRRKTTDAMAHDLKSPMAAILSYAENLENHTGADKQEFYVSKITEKVWQMNKMVNNMLDFSRGENSAVTVKKTAVDIGAVLADAIAENDHEITKRGLTVSYEKASVTVNTDKELFAQAIGNLINNAALYAKDGSTIIVTCDSSKIVITNVAATKVEDAEAMKQPFAKGDESRKNYGSGLGLAIADNNLTMLGYKLDVKSEEDKFVATVTL